MNNGKVDWHGCFVAVVTPFARDGDLDEAAFSRNIDQLVHEAADGIVVSGCTGETWSLTEQERLRTFELAVDTVAGSVPVIAGIGSILTQDVIDLGCAAKDAGAAGAMVLPPYYCHPNDAEVVEHYRRISEGIELPILLYNTPGRTRVDLTPDLLEQIIQNEYVVAIKESSAEFLRVERLLNKFSDAIQVMTGHSADRAVPSVLMGAKGWVSSLETQIMGEEAISMYRLATSGQIQEAIRIQLKAVQLDEEIRQFGTFPANMKAAMNLLGRPGGYPRPPLLPLDGEQIAGVRRVLQSMELLA